MARATPPTQPGQVVHLPRDAAPFLVRIPVMSATWAESMPPMPAGAGVSVAFSDADVEAEHSDAVSLLGYRCVGVVPTLDDLPPSADLLVPREAVDKWPRWRDGILKGGGRVWDLAMGPVATVLGGLVGIHSDGVGLDGGGLDGGGRDDLDRAGHDGDGNR